MTAGDMNSEEFRVERNAIIDARAVRPPVPVEYPMSSTTEIEYDETGNIVATPPTDFDG